MVNYYYQDEKSIKGPLTFDEIRFLIDRGKISANHLLRRDGEKDWIKAGSKQEFFQNQEDNIVVSKSVKSNRVKARSRIQSPETQQEFIEKDERLNNKEEKIISPPPFGKEKTKTDLFFLLFIFLIFLLIITFIYLWLNGTIQGISLFNGSSTQSGQENSSKNTGDNSKESESNTSEDSPPLTSPKNKQKQSKEKDVPGNPTTNVKDQKKTNKNSVKKKSEQKSSISTGERSGNEINPPQNDQQEKSDSSSSGAENNINFLPASSFFGIKSQGESFVYVVDCSGSMQDDGKDLAAKQELINSINGLEEKQIFFVIFFSDLSYPIPMPDNATQSLLPANTNNIKHAENWIQNHRISGGTLPADALLQAISLEPSVIFFLTDGGFSSNVLSLVRNANTQKIKINTIGFKDRAGQQLLETIAKDNGGTYQYVP